MLMFPPSQESRNVRAVHGAVVLDIEEVAPAHFLMRLQAPALAQSAQAGQFVHVLTTPNVSDWTLDPLLRRAFSIMRVDSSAKSFIEVLFRAAGRGTKLLSTARAGDEIDLLGPLGMPFDLAPFFPFSDGTEEFHVKQSPPKALVVGGGVGVPPLVFLSHTLHQHAIEVSAVIGARTATEVIGERDLGFTCRTLQVTTEDGSRGYRGRVTELLIDMLDSSTGRNKDFDVKPVVYACGPLPMLRAVADICAGQDIRCQVSLEENMPCGIGVCNGCVIRALQSALKENSERSIGEPIDGTETVGNVWTPYRAYRRVCVEGPACWADEIDWDFVS